MYPPVVGHTNSPVRYHRNPLQLLRSGVSVPIFVGMAPKMDEDTRKKLLRLAAGTPRRTRRRTPPLVVPKETCTFEYYAHIDALGDGGGEAEVARLRRDVACEEYAYLTSFGTSFEVIAAQLGISPSTLATYLKEGNPTYNTTTPADGPTTTATPETAAPAPGAGAAYATAS